MTAPLTLGYAGSLAYGYGEALVKLISVLREVGARILISTPKPPEKLQALIQAMDVVEWMPHRADINAMWRTMQERADVMILPYSNPAGSHELLYRTHFPSKLTEYLALGMPVIVSGPEFATGVKWAGGVVSRQSSVGREGAGEGGSWQSSVGREKEGDGGRQLAVGRKNEERKVGRVQSEVDRKNGVERGNFDILNRAPNGAVPCTMREELVACLKRLKEDGDVRRELARRAVEAGMRDFDPVEIRENFWILLINTML